MSIKNTIERNGERANRGRGDTASVRPFAFSPLHYNITAISFLFHIVLVIFFPYLTYSQEPIADNSFLIEEAYNQEKRVVQHISLFDFTTTDEIRYYFTQEWPLFGQKHQLSYTIPLIYGGQTIRLDNVASMLNYRYQLVNTENIAFSPRISLIFPSGGGKIFSDQQGGLQGNLPISISIAKKIVTHINFGMTYKHRRTSIYYKENYWESTSGFSLIWLFHPNFNAMLETLNNNAMTKGEVNDRGFNYRESEWVINPGFRGAINFESGLQIVPGISLPVTITDEAAINSVLFYVSFEHGF